MFCENCGTQMVENANVCEECGFVVNPTGISSQVEGEGQIQQEEKSLSPIKNVSKKKLGIMGGAVVVILAAVFLMANLLPSMGSKEKPLLYLTNEGLFATKDKGKAPYLISEDAFVDFYNDYREGIFISQDGTKMFYADNWDSGDSTYDIYMRNPGEEKPSGKDADEKGIRVASNVSSGFDGEPFQVVEDGKYIFYYKDNYTGQGKLYFNDLTEEVKVDSDVSYFEYADGLVFYEKQGESDGITLYASTLEVNPEKEKIGELVSQFRVHGKTAYYTTYSSEDGQSKMYMKEWGKDKVKLDEGGINMIYLTAAGTVYYQKTAETGGTLYDYVEDDMLEEDSQITEPDISNYQTEEYVDQYFYSYYDTVTDYESYYEARDAYYEKQDRDYIREYLQNNSAFGNLYSIYTVEKGKRVMVCEAAANTNSIWENKDLVGLSYVRNNVEYSGPVVKLSELQSPEEVYSYFDEEASKDLCVALGNGKTSVVQKNTEKGFDLEIYIFGNSLVYLDYNDASLSVSDINGGTAGTLKSLDYDVGSIAKQGKKDTLYYYKDVDQQGNGDYYQYKDGKSKKLASDVFVGSVVPLGDSDDFAYVADYDHNKEEGTGYLVKSGKGKIRLGDDIHQVYSVDGKIYFLQDFSMKNRRGDLKKFIKEGTVELVDEDVSFVII